MLSVVILSYTLMRSVQMLEAAEMTGPSKILIVWTSYDRDVALKMVFMYTFNAKKNKWWDEVRLLVWGPSSKLLSEDQELQDYVKKMKDAGVILEACKACADMYGVSDKLGALGMDVKYMGKPLTDMIKSGWVTLTF
jgi:hypothetical protein